MIEVKANNTCGQDDLWGNSRPRDIRLQISISVTVGVVAFLVFCFLRPRWKGLYAARKKQNDLATALPDLPDSFFGWMLPLWRITDEQVLASAGLDAYVYLAFFKMAIKFLLVTLFFALAVIKPVHDTHKEGKKLPVPDDGKHKEHLETRGALAALASEYEYYTDYLWMYLVFVYLFTGLIMYLIVSETRRIIDIRQEYLGSQTTITDRTIRLSGIPLELRSEDKIKDFIEDLQIGKVESVTLCRNWKELDTTFVERQNILRKLEEAWTVHLGSRRVERSLETLPVVQPTPRQSADRSHDDDGDHEASRLIQDVDRDPGYITPYAKPRPKTKIRYGRFRLRYKIVDSIDYYEEKLRRIDEDIRSLRKKTFEPTPLAFVTMDSVASAQMAIQAVLDPSPLQLLANNSPAPSDVVWSNTYLSRNQRIIRSWLITFIIGVLSIFWTTLFVPIAGALNTCSINEVFPGLAKALGRHEVFESLVNTQLPTLALTLINVAVPFLYDWLANMQGMISQGDVELSVISKNFFFTFFNFFIFFTILGTVSGLVAMWEQFAEKLTSATEIAYALARSLSDLLGFYTNFIILQAFGLFPLRLMELGALSLYPVYLIGAKTPRDYAELVQPPVFSYGFFLPQTILIFIICMVYSVLRDSWQVLLTGLAYFMIGHFVHKYQLLYAMEHRQHSTGRGWTMMCDRMIGGAVLFQITVAGQLALKKAFKRALLVAPLIIATLWFFYVFARTYRPLMKFIALRSLRNPVPSDLGRDVQEEAVLSGREGFRMPSGRLTLDEARERNLRFENPTLVMPTAPQTRGATRTSSQILLSRGVADTKSHPALPILGSQPLHVASYFQSPGRRTLSLSPPLIQSATMSHTSNESSRAPGLAEATASSPASPAWHISNGSPEPQDPSPPRSDVLRRVLPRSAREGPSRVATSMSRILKSYSHNVGVHAGVRLKSRAAIHKYITAMFSHSHDDHADPDTSLSRSRTFSFGSKPESLLQVSVPSIDFISPAAFVFSGPSLQTLPFPHRSTSRLPSLTGTETDSEMRLFNRTCTDSFSMLDNASDAAEGILEPLVDTDIVRAMSDILFGVSTPIEEEIVQHMYSFLGPSDFNAARRSCRNWMRASLDTTLLKVMLSRGGWSRSARNASEGETQPLDEDTDSALQSEPWILSRYLSRQCALLSNWTGNGLDDRPVIMEHSHIDFADMASGYSSVQSDQSGALVFQKSVCGFFLMVAQDSLIYVYSLCSGSLTPVTSVVCPRRVLSMSMDVSCGRHAVAALLEGRMGIVCELRYGHPLECESPIEFSSVDVQADHQAIGLEGIDDHRQHDRNLVSTTWHLNMRSQPQLLSSPVRSAARTYSQSLPIENGTSTFYRHLCSEDDPPRSVSICPQRRCFPLTAPSDYLHFLAPRPGFESAKKLRLISSAAHPNDRPALRRNLFFSKPTYASFWGSFGFESTSRTSGIPGCDHYHAVPLSDGRHILFLDPSNDRLTLGCDAPLGGPTKLLRKIVFIPSGNTQVPRLYSAAADLSEGARIVVAFGETIMLYSVPPEVIRLSQMEQKAESWDVYTAPPFSSEGRSENHWLNWWEGSAAVGTASRAGTDQPNTIWPLAIDGTEIGKCDNICELAIQTRPDIIIWAFTHNSQCWMWRLHNYVDPVIRLEFRVCRDGVVHDEYSVDETGDVIMTDAPTSPSHKAIDLRVHGDDYEHPRAERSIMVGMDGNASGVVKRMPKALAVENDDWVDLVDVRGCEDAWYDADGDVMMFHEV
ncbi:DUF221-domain-containing protein [Setomelanomma holmii]|uniref:DUF221-domain-containing protein n=1 Tax=Setomelanomma holmii TaxID=210430 RepID=A0A9P4HB88_9PLEO|nr:DUF221-domain-containing protein [Setomelanomma holmii]